MIKMRMIWLSRRMVKIRVLIINHHEECIKIVWKNHNNTIEIATMISMLKIRMNKTQTIPIVRMIMLGKY